MAISLPSDERSEARITQAPIADAARRRELGLSQLLLLFVAGGLAFMLLPGTFLGVWNLVSISSRTSAGSVSADWLQAHGHAQVFGWVASFILGVGFYTIPKLRRSRPFALWLARCCWALWTLGVAMRWITNLYQWRWRILLPFSAALELLAFFIFLYSVAGHASAKKNAGTGAKVELWWLTVAGAVAGWQ